MKRVGLILNQWSGLLNSTPSQGYSIPEKHHRENSMKVTKLLSLILAPVLPACHTAQSQQAVSYNIEDIALMAINNNQQLEAQRLAPLVQEQAVREAWAAFDPVLQGGVSYEDQERHLDQRSANALNSIFGGGDGEDSTIYLEQNAVYQASFQGILPSGTQYSLSVVNNEINNDTNDFNSEFTSETRLQVTQPILRGFGPEYNLAVVRLQESRLDQERYRLHGLVTQVLEQTLGTCAELIFAQENLKVKADAIDLAKKLYEDNKRRVEQGRMSEIDVMQAETRISEAEEEALQAEIFHLTRVNQLRALIYEDTEDWHDVPLTIQGQLELREDLPERSSLVEAAKENNSQYLAAIEQIEERDISYQRSRKDMLPAVNVVGSIGYQGLDFDDSYKSMQDYENRNGPNWSLGVAVEVPLWNQAAKASRTAALLGKRQARYNLNQIKNNLVSGLDQSLGTVEVAKRRIDTAARSVSLAERALKAEEARLENGRTTSFNVAELQRDLSEARTRELAAKVEYQRALISLWALVGRLDEQLRLKLEARDDWNTQQDIPFTETPKPWVNEAAELEKVEAEAEYPPKPPRLNEEGERTDLPTVYDPEDYEFPSGIRSKQRVTPR